MSENNYQHQSETRIENEALWTGRRLLDRLKEIESSPNHLPEDTQDFHQRLSEYDKECLKIAMFDDPFSYEHEIDKQDEMIRVGKNIYEKYKEIQNDPDEKSRFISSLTPKQLKCLELVDSNIKLSIQSNIDEKPITSSSTTTTDSSQMAELSNKIDILTNVVTDDGLFSITVEEAIDRYLEHYFKNRIENNDEVIPPKTKDDKYRTLITFSVILGKQRVLKSITQNIIENDYVAIAKIIPARLNTIYKYPAEKKNYEILELHFEEIVKIGINKERKRKDNVTLNREFTTVKMFLKWAEERKFITTGLGRFIPSMSSEAKPPKPVFSDEDYTLLFNSKWYLQGKFKHPSQFWIPLIAIFTGFRGNEIAFIMKEDVKRHPENDIWYIYIRPNRELEKRTKTKSATRSVPIHPILKKFGFLEYIESINQGSRIFPELKESGSGDFYKTFGNNFNRLEIEKKQGIQLFNKDGSPRLRRGYMAQCGVDKSYTDELGTASKTFHSFRHYVTNHFDKIGVDTRIKNFIIGHKHVSGSVDTYIHPDKDDLAKAYKAVQKLTYSFIDFSKIRIKRWKS